MKNKNKIKIKANGKKITIKSNCSLKELIIQLKLPTKMVAIELNRKIINKSKLDKIALKENDNLEIVHFIGGG